MHVAEGKERQDGGGGVNGMEKGDSATGSQQEISRSGAIMFLMPRFRSGVMLGVGSLQILIARERKNESAIERG